MEDETNAVPADLDAKIAKAVSDALAPIAAKLQEKATNNATGLPVDGEASSTHRPVVGKEVSDGTGINAIRLLKAVATAELETKRAMRYVSPADVAKSWGYSRIEKALSQGSFADGGSLVHEQFAGELVELLRNMTVVRRAGARVVPMPSGNLTWDRQSAAGTASYGGETANIAPSSQSTEQFRLSEKKLTALTAVSNDLIRNASVSAEEFVRQDLLTVMAIREDLAFLRGSGTQYEPTGLRYRIVSGNIYAETVNTEGSPTLAEVKAELQKAIKKLRKANIQMVKPVWFMNANAEQGFMGLLGPGGEGFNSLEREYSERGTLRGFPVFVTEQIPSNLGTDGDEGELYLVDMNEVIIGESMAMELAVFPNGAFDNNGTIVSGISSDQTVIRAISKHDINMRHTNGGVVVTELSWGYAG